MKSKYQSTRSITFNFSNQNILCTIGIITLLFLFMGSFAGCAGVPVNYDASPQVPNKILDTKIGDIFFERETMTGEDNRAGWVFFGNAMRIELSVRAATKDKLVLDYSEYTKPMNQSGGYQRYGQWFKRPAFDKTMEYDLTDSKIISFQKYEFEIIEIKGGRITYKRLK
jgi:hypothetical protein